VPLPRSSAQDRKLLAEHHDLELEHSPPNDQPTGQPTARYS